MAQITPRGAPSAPVAPAAPPARDITGQPDKASGAGAPPATGQPGSPEDTQAQRLQALARQQAANRAAQRQREERERAAQAERERVQAERQQEQRDLAAARAQIARLKTDPYGVMLDLGLTADQVAGLLMQQPDVPSQKITQLEAELAKARQDIEGLRNGQSEQQSQSRESAKKQIAHDVRTIVKADTTLEAMNAYGDEAVQAVVALIERTFDEDGILMDTSEAITEVEEYLVEQSLKAANIGKVKARMTPAEANAVIEAAAAAPAAPQPQQKPQKMKTLSTAMVPGTPSKLNAAQRRERAILAFQGKLA